jgi:hypothetical protein
MPGDFSRSSVDMTKSYTGVLMQQGRVQLDADWNEQLALTQHRTHTEARDAIGLCGTPKGKGGFKIEITRNEEDFFIKPGRFYVGGLLCEIDPEWVPLTFRALNVHEKRQALLLKKFGGLKLAVLPSSWLDGRPLREGDWLELRAEKQKDSLYVRITDIGDTGWVTFDIPLGVFETSGAVVARRAITYLTQPFYPWPDPAPGVDSPPTSPLSSPWQHGLNLKDGDYFIYLEAYQREVNALEDPHIREVALGGPDHGERVQTIWQVKVLPVDFQSDQILKNAEGEDRCSADYPVWNQLVAAARTTGKLSAQTTPQQPGSNPCLLPPSAGYQGLENQLFRVEIFQGGTTRETSYFVWSRDNAMVETSIVSADAANPNVIKVADLGKDDLHSFQVNDWVEVVNRDGELQGSPRFLAQIVAPAPDPSNNNITLSANVPDVDAINNPGTNVFRLRRWDMTGPSVTPNGIQMKAGTIALESGIEITFEQGAYAPRAFWQIPARTATADIEWPPFQGSGVPPLPQPPLGRYHYFCRLALVTSAYGKWHLEDCRRQFPSLTHICADDVCFHSHCDELDEAETVQAALDRVCDALKLRFHKKYLHGWGIVCGLEVDCGGDGSSVTVNPGYAITCRGDDILQRKAVPFDVISNIRTPSGVADGEYSLFFDPTANNALKTEPYTPPAKPFEAALQNTFWVDYKKQYLQPLVDFWTSLQNTPAGAIVNNEQRLLSSLINLFVQYVDPVNGARVYVSKEEHDVLTQVFQTVSKLLGKDTSFCGMSSSLNAMPEYPEQIAGIHSGFGEGVKTRLRMAEIGTVAAACGHDNTIHIYTIHDPDPPVLSQILTFPGGSSFVVQDCAVSADGATLYAIANDGTNSQFGFIPLAAGSAWKTATINGVLLNTLATLQQRFFATAINKGLYAFTIAANGAITAAQSLAFNAIGPLAAAGANLFAAANATASVLGQFNIILALAAAGNEIVARYELPIGLVGTVNDDLNVIVRPGANTPGQRIYVTAGPSGGTARTLAVNFSAGPATGIGAWATTPLGPSGNFRLAFHSAAGKMAISSSVANNISLLTETASPSGTILQTKVSFPAEVSPESMLANDRSNALFVLNSASNTISVVPYTQKPWVAAQWTKLQQYRQAAILAWLDLFAALLQYLKDGFCQLLLLKCNVCEQEENKPVYLAVVRVKQGKVYNICNLDQRRYVKTFPGVEYWLSIVPVLPILEYVVREVCCYVFNFESFLPKGEQAANVNFTEGARTFYAKKSQVTNFNLASVSTLIGNKLTGSRSFAGDFASSLFRPAAAAPQPAAAVSGDRVTGKPLAEAQALLAPNVMVNVEPYDAGNLATNVTRSIAAPTAIPAGSSATLFVDEAGNVKYFTVAPYQVQEVQKQVTAVTAAQAAAQPILNNVAVVTNQLADLRLQITNLQATHTQELATRDAAIADVKTQLASLQAASAKELAARDTLIANLTSSTQELRTTLTNLSTQVSKLPKPNA